MIVPLQCPSSQADLVRRILADSSVHSYPYLTKLYIKTQSDLILCRGVKFFFSSKESTLDYVLRPRRRRRKIYIDRIMTPLYDKAVLPSAGNKYGWFLSAYLNVYSTEVLLTLQIPSIWRIESNEVGKYNARL